VRHIPAFALVLLSGLAAPLVAHQHPCAHTHVPGAPQWHTCNSPGATCTGANGNTGTCKTTKSPIIASARWCECVEDDQGCLSLSLTNFTADGVPGPFATINYATAFHPESFSLMNLGSATPIAGFTAEEQPVTGFMTLEFGSFTDPKSVPVDLHALDLAYPSLTIGSMSTGPHQIFLPDGEEQALLYDAETGVLRAAGGAIFLAFANAAGKGQGVVYLDGQIDGEGSLLAYTQASAPPPPFHIFFDNFEIGTPEAWSSMASVGLGSGWILLIAAALRRTS
jgi:hypothetical protein